MTAVRRDARAPSSPAALETADAGAELLRDASEARLCSEQSMLSRRSRTPSGEAATQLAAGLSDRELDVLLALAAGKTNKEIAQSLGISAKTAGHHVQHVFDKTGARTRTAATGWAVEHSLVQLHPDAR